MMRKAERRYEAKKRIAKWAKILEKEFNALRSENYLGGKEQMDRDKQRCIHIRAKTPHPCSCQVCGNQRKYIGKTNKEKRQLQDSFSQLNTETEE